MNRIKLSPLAANPAVETVAEPRVLPSRPVKGPIREELSLFVPLHYERNYAYPLVVWLHPDGQSASQVQQVMIDLSMRNYVAVAPQSPNGSPRTGFFWDQDWETIESAHQSVTEAIDLAATRCNIHSKRIFLAGMGSGGSMAFRLAFHRPDLFAGVMSINGPLPTDHAPLRDWGRCRQMPVYWTHGRNCSDFDQEQLCRQLKLLHIAGFSVTLRQYTTDSACPQMMSDMNRWIMEMIHSAVLDPQER